MYLNLFLHILCLSYCYMASILRPLDCVVYMEVWECCNGDRMVSGICKGHVSIILTLGKVCALGL